MDKGISAPEYIRVKRRRDEDSVQALLLEEERNTKKGKFLFKLTETVEGDSFSADSPLLKLSSENNRSVYILERKRRHSFEETQELPSKISEMLADYLKLNEEKPECQKKRKPSRKHSISNDIPQFPSVDYVYDVYVREAVQEDEFIFDQGTVGYIKIVEDNGSLIPEEDEEHKTTLMSDDEDSNEEDYYRNDYPEDEDDDRSIIIGSDEEDSSLEEIVYLNSETNVKAEEDADFDALFHTFGEEKNLLSSLNANNYVDLDYDDNEEELKLDESENEVVSRNKFFPTDEEDEMAMHRDLIFHKLQKMIDRS